MPPIYPLRCAKCEKVQEVLCRSDELHEQQCKECGSYELARLITAHNSYTFSGGSGGASVTPKKFRSVK